MAFSPDDDSRTSREAVDGPRPVGPSAWEMPDPADADPESGLVAVGADLAPATLIDAYRRGIFPWPHEGIPLPWFSPDPRGILRPGEVRMSKSLRQRLRRSGWTTTVDVDFPAVVDGCSAPRPGESGTWITPEMTLAYERLHRLGWAHSVEVWDGDDLVGGLYGIQIGAVFTGESMFHHATDASKVALVDLARRLVDAGALLIDVQMPTDHLCSLGVVPVPRGEFLRILEAGRDVPVRLSRRRRQVARLVAAASR